MDKDGTDLLVLQGDGALSFSPGNGAAAFSFNSTNSTLSTNISSSKHISASALYGNNIGPYHSKRILILPEDFGPSDNSSGRGGVFPASSAEVRVTSDYKLRASYVIPFGMRVKQSQIFAFNSDVTATIYEAHVGTSTLLTRQSAFNNDDGNVTFGTPTTVGDGFRYVVVELDFNANTAIGFLGGYLNYGY